MTDPHATLKNAFARYTTGVTVVTCRAADGAHVGLTVNSFTSVSLKPALVLWCLDRHASLFPDFEQASAYAVSVLAADQERYSNRFATPGQHAVFDDEAETFGTGAALLKGRIAGFDCRIVERHKAGDHVILVGEIDHFDSRDAEPLIYTGRKYLKGPAIAD